MRRKKRSHFWGEENAITLHPSSFTLHPSSFITDIMITCPKCQGSRYIQKYSSLDSGFCFLCSGIGAVDSKKARDFKASQTRKKKMQKPQPPQGAVQVVGCNLKKGQKVWLCEKTLKGWDVQELTVLSATPYVTFDNQATYSQTGKYWVLPSS